MSFIHRMFFVAAGAAVCCSCQVNTPARGASVGVRTYSDSVVHIGQVDPAYRAYFRDQNASNYSLSDQRKAYYAAAQTARTPVRESDYRPGDIRKRVVANNKARNGKSRGRVAATKKTSAKKSTAMRKSPTRR